MSWTTLIVVLAVGSSYELRTRTTASMLERDLEERSTLLVRAAIRTFDFQTGTIDPAVVEPRFRDFMDADPAMSRLDLVQSVGSTLTVLASTSDIARPLIDTLPEAPGTRIEVRSGTRELITIEPIADTEFWVVAATSLEGLDRYVAVNRAWAAVFSVGLIITVLLLTSFLFDRLISRRFDRLLADLGRADQTRLSEALSSQPDDEIGVLAEMFGSLLSSVRSLNADLKSQVDAATESLNARNRRLEKTTHELIAMEKKLLQSERMATLGQMAATFAHEIGSPLSALSAHIQLLLEEPDLAAQQEQTLFMVRDEIDSLVQIVNEWLRTARHGPEDFVLVNMSEVMESVHRLVEPRLRSQKIEVHSLLEPVPPIRGYPVYLQEALLNLINNASEAMPRGGQLELHVWHDEEEGRVKIRIGDSGPGIDPRIVDRVFEHFVTTRSLGNGTGLGLAIVKDVVTRHGGTVELSSRSGDGTTALLAFPAFIAERNNGTAANTRS